MSLKFYSMAASILVPNESILYTAALFGCNKSKAKAEYEFREHIKLMKGVYPVEIHTIEMPLYQPLLYLIKAFLHQLKII